MTTTKTQYDFASKYTRVNWLTSFVLEKFYHSLFELLRLVPFTHNYYEIGCGEGFSSEKINSFLKKNHPATFTYNACDVEDRLIIEAKKRNPALNITNQSVYDISKKLEKVDVIFLLEVLEHLEDPELALKEVLATNASYLITSVPREPIWCFLNFIRGKYWTSWGNTPGHIQHWSRSAFLHLLQQYGEIISSKTPIPWTIVLVKLNKK